jgi:hypothetical protein
VGFFFSLRNPIFSHYPNYSWSLVLRAVFFFLVVYVCVITPHNNTGTFSRVMATFEDQTITSQSFCTDNSEATNVALFSQMLGRSVTSVAVESMSGAGGFSGEMTRVRVQFAETDVGAEGGREKVMVMKHTKENGATSSKALGLAREGKFYEWVASSDDKTYHNLLPDIYYSKGDMTSGDKVILLEDLGHLVQTGYFFGAGSPLNWGRDLEKEVASKGMSLQPTDSAVTANVTELVAEAACLLAAKYHGEHWMQKNLLEGNIWLKASDWYVGQGEQSWQGGQKYIKDAWDILKTTKATVDNTACIWSPYIIGLIDASISKISWAGYQDRVRNAHFTLAHGDFHPANMMCSFDNALLEAGELTAEDITIRLVDWEVVGVGSGAQDIGQYMMSHMTPDARRHCEDRLLRVYYNQLQATIAARKGEGEGGEEGGDYVSGLGDFTFEMCQREYVYGGVERWMFLLIILANMCPDAMQQYFLNQVEAFAKDHGVTAESIGMSRL